MRCMTTTLLAAVLLLGCPSAQSICRSGVDQVCERTFECRSEEEKASPQFQAVFGTSEDQCKDRLYQNPLAFAGGQSLPCDDVTNDTLLCANLGVPNATDFDLGAARDCRADRDDLSCAAYFAQLTDPALAPTACGQRCQ
jgi:hypothetical protein